MRLENLGSLGIVLALTGAIIWLLVDIGLLHTTSVSGIAWVALICLAVILTVGVSWSHIWRRMTGQVSVDHVEE